MNIGDRYSDKKVYRGIRTSNGLPFLSEDFHEFSDTLAAKNKYLLESILGSGLLTEVNPSISNAGIKLVSPLVLNILGDICLIKNSEDTQLITNSKLNPSGTTDKGEVFLIGWYQHLTSSSTMREYGGVVNSEIENNLIYEPLDIQVSTRYQFMWDIVAREGELTESFSLSLDNRDSEGNLLGSTSTLDITPEAASGSIYKLPAPDTMDYAMDGLYIVPLFSYEYDTSNNIVKTVEGYPIQRTSSSMTMITSDEEPTGKKFTDGTVWFNPNTREFKTYVEGIGFVASASKMGFIQYQYVDIATTDTLSPTNLVYGIDVPSLQEGDIIQVTYEGLELVPGYDYVINVANKTITLNEFTRTTGEKLVVNVTRLVEASDVTSLTSTLVSHMNTIGSSTVEGHVKLSDSVDSEDDVYEGIAATPKAVKESRLISNDTTGTKYKFGVENGILYLEEV